MSLCFSNPPRFHPVPMSQTPSKTSLSVGLIILGRRKKTRLPRVFCNIDARRRRKQESQNLLFGSCAWVSCLRRAGFQSGLCRSCSLASVTVKGTPSGWHLGVQPLPVGAGRPDCHRQLAFTRPTRWSVVPALGCASLGAALQRSARGQPVSRAAPGVTSCLPTWACGLGAGRPDHAQASPSLETGCPRAERLGRGLHPHQPFVSVRFAHSTAGGQHVGVLPCWRLPHPHSWRWGASSFGGAARRSPGSLALPLPHA